MFCKLNRKRAQTTAEYAILIAVVVGALIGMQIYVRRGLQGRIRSVVDQAATYSQTGDAATDPNPITLQVSFDGKQFEPYYLQSGEITQTAGGQESRTGDTATGIIAGEAGRWSDRAGERESATGITLGGATP